MNDEQQPYKIYYRSKHTRELVTFDYSGGEAGAVMWLEGLQKTNGGLAELWRGDQHVASRGNGK